MKILSIIIITFILVFLTSGLLDIIWIYSNPVRYTLVVILLLVELLTGYFYAKAESN
jgi:hypothetical protein